MPQHAEKLRSEVIEAFGLASLTPPVDLSSLAAMWGVLAIEYKDISSDAMLLPSYRGYVIVLKKALSPGEIVRQRFSFAHELGHLLLSKMGSSTIPGSAPAHRSEKSRGQEERLCDQIAAEILMPRVAFTAEASRLGWSLNGLKGLTRQYGTSFQATASRLIELVPESSLMGVWEPATTESDSHKLHHSITSKSSFGIRNSNRVPRRRLWLIARASNSANVETGIAPVVDKRHPSSLPLDVPAEALAWGKGEHQKVLVFYYPERELSEDMMAVANVMGRMF